MARTVEKISSDKKTKPKPSAKKKTYMSASPSIAKTKKLLKISQITRIQKEINNLQKTTNLLIPKKPFERLVREIGEGMHSDLRFQPDAIGALQEATEAYITECFTKVNMCAINSNRATIKYKDFVLVKMIKDEDVKI
uniref:Histone domain-containing protein n=1 Tax=Parastrongyloides trichosuri TaxID=131310 RepID=A0A0N4ZHM6_PARTI